MLLILPVLGILWLDSNWNLGVVGVWSVLATAVASLVVASEFIAMIEERTPGVNRPVVYVGAVLCHVAVTLPGVLPTELPILNHRWSLNSAVMCAILLATFLAETLTYRPDRKSMERVALTLLVVLYAGWMLSFFSAVRVTRENIEGVFAIFSIMFIIKMSDAGAYFVGKRWGRHKLAPVLSPGKTIEGLWGGLLSGVLAAFLAFQLLAPLMNAKLEPSWWAVLGYALSITIVGVFGDLAESMIKREMGVKDSSGWLPGLGGIMDTADSVILASPMAYAWWASGCLS